MAEQSGSDVAPSDGQRSRLAANGATQATSPRAPATLADDRSKTASVAAVAAAPSSTSAVLRPHEDLVERHAAAAAAAKAQADALAQLAASRDGGERPSKRDGKGPDESAVAAAFASSSSSSAAAAAAAAAVAEQQRQLLAHAEYQRNLELARQFEWQRQLSQLQLQQQQQQQQQLRGSSGSPSSSVMQHIQQRLHERIHMKQQQTALEQLRQHAGTEPPVDEQERLRQEALQRLHHLQLHKLQQQRLLHEHVAASSGQSSALRVTLSGVPSAAADASASALQRLRLEQERLRRLQLQTASTAPVAAASAGSAAKPSASTTASTPVAVKPSGQQEPPQTSAAAPKKKPKPKRSTEGQLETLAKIICRLQCARTDSEFRNTLDRLLTWSQRSTDVGLQRLALQDYETIFKAKRPSLEKGRLWATEIQAKCALVQQTLEQLVARPVSTGASTTSDAVGRQAPPAKPDAAVHASPEKRSTADATSVPSTAPENASTEEPASASAVASRPADVGAPATQAKELVAASPTKSTGADALPAVNSSTATSAESKANPATTSAADAKPAGATSAAPAPVATSPAQPSPWERTYTALKAELLAVLEQQQLQKARAAAIAKATSVPPANAWAGAVATVGKPTANAAPQKRPLAVETAPTSESEQKSRKTEHGKAINALAPATPQPVATPRVISPRVVQHVFDVELATRSCAIAVDEGEDRFYFPTKVISSIMRRALPGGSTERLPRKRKRRAKVDDDAKASAVSGKTTKRKKTEDQDGGSNGEEEENDDNEEDEEEEHDEDADDGAAGADEPPSQVPGEQAETDRVTKLNELLQSRLRQAEGIKIDDAAATLVQECVTEFMLFLASEARDHSMLEKRKAAITGTNLVAALRNLGFDSYATVLGRLNDKFRKLQDDQAQKKKEAKEQQKRVAQQQQQSSVETGATTTATTTTSQAPAADQQQPAPPAAEESSTAAVEKHCEPSSDAAASDAEPAAPVVSDPSET
ncbi:hypothetical protein ATCC90586_005422 [Pythium insidiosum]|nr:hypothetical protein ATCC90586_005422 [Pythium insidiosum]